MAIQGTIKAKSSQMVDQWTSLGGTPLYGLYGDMSLNGIIMVFVPSVLNRIIISGESFLKRVYNFVPVCPKQGIKILPKSVLNRVIKGLYLGNFFVLNRVRVSGLS